MRKRALITGITGQDGSYLSELLLKKNYQVHGLIRRVAAEDRTHRLWRLKHILNKITLHPASLESYASMVKIIQRIKRICMTKKKILIATGGTGGHVFPAYSLANYLTNKNFSVRLTVDERGRNYLKDYDNLDLTNSSLLNATSVQTQTLSIGGTAFTGSYTDLTNTPTIPADISDLTDTQGLLGQGGGGGSTIIQGGGGLIITADDSVQRTILPGNTLQIQGSGDVSTSFTNVGGTDTLTISVSQNQDNNTTSIFRDMLHRSSIRPP